MSLCKRQLLQCATPEAIVRINQTEIQHETQEIRKIYLNDQRHESLSEYLALRLQENSDNRDTFIQVLIIIISYLCFKYAHSSVFHIKSNNMSGVWYSKQRLPRVLTQSNLLFYSEMSFSSYFCAFILIGVVITKEYPSVSDSNLSFLL